MDDTMKTELLSSLTLGDDPNTDYKKVAAWFLGPKGENCDQFINLVSDSIREHSEFRRVSYKLGDPEYISDEVKRSTEYRAMINNLSSYRKKLSDELKKSVPFFSQRYQAHMNWDTVMAGNLGYITAMLYNQNNVATEASPVTCRLEKEVGDDLCHMLGYDVSKSWGHITADGTIANIESMWAARNLKALPLAVKELLNSDGKYSNAWRNLLVSVPENGRQVKQPLFTCTAWQLLNVPVDEALSLPQKIVDMCSRAGVTMEIYNEEIKEYLIQNKGVAYYASKYKEGRSDYITNMKVLVPATRHYSWPKAATLLGLGQDSVLDIPVDPYGRMDINELNKALASCMSNNWPVLMVVAVIGSTAEGVIDDLKSIIKLKENFASSGMQFHLHCDAAWGGYIRTVMIDPPPQETASIVKKAHFVPALPLSDYAVTQLNLMGYADTITVDPHKSGFIPYPAGALCYKNKLLRYLITFEAAYIHSEADANMGIFGVEGSKPGAAPAAVWLAHKTIPLNKDGYGQILGECSYSSKIYYCNWLMLDKEKSINDTNPNFCIEPLIPLPEKITGTRGVNGFDSRDEMLRYIITNIRGKTGKEIYKDERATLLLRNIGADVLINTFIVNFKTSGRVNTDIVKLNELNRLLFEMFSITKPEQATGSVDYILTMNTLSAAQYGAPFKTIMGKWGVRHDNSCSLNFLVNTTLQPWPNNPEFVQEIMETFKAGIMKCIDQIMIRRG